MPSLTDNQKRFVLQCKAEGVRDKHIIESLQEAFPKDMEGLTRQNLEIYDPMSIRFNDLSEDLKAYFFACVQLAEQQIVRIPLANRFYRIKRLQEIIDNEDNEDNNILLKDVIKQAAQDRGGMFEQRPPTGASPKEVEEYVREKFESVRHVIETLVTDPEVKKNVLDQIEKESRVES